MSNKAAFAAGFTLPSVNRTVVKTEAADRFVGTKPKSKGERITVYVPPDLAETLRVTCAKERRSLSDAASEALRMWASEHVNK